MSLKSPPKLDTWEVRYISTLGSPAGWLTALSVAICTIAAGYFIALLLLVAS